MTAARARVLERLAERGRPQMWANEHESAVLSGLSADTFRQKLRDLELRGFPKANPLNGKRSIPAILAFWKLAVDDAPATIDERELEHWQ